MTLSNLDITENSSTGSLEGTLLERLDQCSTPFGKSFYGTSFLSLPLLFPRQEPPDTFLEQFSDDNKIIGIEVLPGDPRAELS